MDHLQAWGRHLAGKPVSWPALFRERTSRQDSRLADMPVGPTCLAKQGY